MANLQYTSGIKSDVLFRASEPTDGTSDFDSQVLAYINRAYKAIWMGGSELDPEIDEDWNWLRKRPPGVLNISPAYTTGTVSVTNGSTSGSFSSIPVDPNSNQISLANWFLQVSGVQDLYRISVHTAGSTSFTLDSMFTDVTNAAASFIAFNVEYDLATDVLKLVSPMRTYQQTKYQIDGIGQEAMDRDYPLARIVGGTTPDCFCMVGDQRVRFSHYGDLSGNGIYYRVEYDYLYRPADLTNGANEEPVIPIHYRRLLADFALYFVFMDMGDNRADAVGMMAKQGLKAMSAENRGKLTEMSENFGRIMPRPGILENKILRTSSGMIVSG